jgi:hypothetical protein
MIFKILSVFITQRIFEAQLKYIPAEEINSKSYGKKEMIIRKKVSQFLKIF